MDYESIVKAVDKLAVYYDNERIFFNDFEKKLFEVFDKENSKSSLYIFPKDNIYFLIIYIVICGLKQYVTNIYGEGNNLLDEIKEGDILEYSKAKCRFEGFDDDKLKLRFQDLIYRLPKDQIYKVTIYKGTAKRLNKYPSNSNRGIKKTRNILSSILDIETGAFTKVIKSSTLIVVNKDTIFNVADKMKILFEGELLDIGNVFHMAYCSSEDKYYFFKGNSAKQEPLIKFTSKVYAARDLVKKNKKITEVIVLQDKLNSDDISDLYYISEKKNIKELSVILDPSELEKNIDNVIMKENFNVVNVDSDFLRNFSFRNNNLSNKRQYKIIDKYTNQKEKFITINDDYADNFRKSILHLCRNVINMFPDCNEIIEFVIKARTISKTLLSMVVPLKEYEKYYLEKEGKQGTLKYKIEELKEFISSEYCTQFTDEFNTKLKFIHELCMDFYDTEYKLNKKWRELETIVRLTQSQSTAVIVENKRIRTVLKEYLKIRYSLKYNIFVKNLKQIRGKSYERVVYTSNLRDKRYWTYLNCNSKNIIFILTKFEKNYIKYLKRRYYSYLSTFNNLGDISSCSFTNTSNMFSGEDIDNVINLDNELDRIITTNYTPSVIVENSNNTTLYKCEYVLKFEDNEKAFITKEYSACILDESKETVRIKKPKEIEKGDTLLFTETVEKDLIDKIMSKLMEVEEVKARYINDYKIVCKWKSQLREFMEKNEYTYGDVEKLLIKNGISRSGASIRSWLINAIIGPSDIEVYQALGKITGISLLNNRYNECLNACSNIRKLQIKLRKAVARYLLKSSVNESEDGLDKYIKACIEGEGKMIKKLTVENIYKINRNIPIYLTNRILCE